MMKIAKKTFFPPVFYLQTLNGTNGFTIGAVNQFENYGYSGDVNVDGINDTI